MFFVFVSEISCTSTKIVFKIITILVELESYSEIKDINSIKSWVYDLGGGVMVPSWGYSCLATLVLWFSVVSH